MNTRRTLLLLAVAAVPLVAGAQERATAPADAEVYIISPADGAIVQSPVTVRCGLRGMGVAPAGVEREKTGHHHLLVDLDSPPPVGQPIPSDYNHRHFGGGQTETTLELSPGEHKLQLLLADHAHLQHRPPVLSLPITITVE